MNICKGETRWNLQGVCGGYDGHKFLHWWKQMNESSAELVTGYHGHSWYMAKNSNLSFSTFFITISMFQLCQSPGGVKPSLVLLAVSPEAREVVNSLHSPFCHQGNCLAGAFPLGDEQCCLWEMEWYKQNGPVLPFIFCVIILRYFVPLCCWMCLSALQYSFRAGFVHGELSNCWSLEGIKAGVSNTTILAMFYVYSHSLLNELSI